MGELTRLTGEGVPGPAAEITNRLNEITFNASLIRELRAIAFAARLVDGQASGPEIDRLKKMHVHMIEAEEAMETLGVASNLNTDLDFLLYLKHPARPTPGPCLQPHFP